MIATWIKYVNSGFRLDQLCEFEKAQIAELLRRRAAVSDRLGPLTTTAQTATARW